MQKVTSKAVAKVAAVATGLAMASSMLSLAPMAHAASLTSSQVQSILSLLSSFGADSATIANVQAALTGQPTTTTSTGSTASSCSFTMSLTIGNKGADVTCLQNALIAAGYSIPAGATGYFGSQTQAAVAAWQKANGISPAVGYFGPISRAHWNLSGGTSSTGSTGGTAVTGNGLKISLAPTSPNGTVLVAGQGIGDLGDFVFANPTSAPINVTSLTFNRTGVSNDSTMTNVYLYHNATRVTDSAGISSGSFSYTNSNGLFTVPAGGTYTVSVRSDIASGTSGQQIGVSLVSATSNGTLDSSVSFPIASGYQTISAASLASVAFAGTTLPATNSSLSPTADYTVWQNTVSVSTNPVKLQSLMLTNLGSIDASDVQNLRLYVDGVQVGTAASQLNSDGTVTFDLTSNPVLLSTANHVIKVIANIVGGSSRTVKLSLQRSSDVMFVDTQLNQPVSPTTGTATTFSSSDVTSGQQTIAAVTSTSGVSVSKASASPTNDIAKGATGVKLAAFNFLATGEPVKISDLYVYAATTTVPVTNSSSWYLTNGKIMVNGVQVGSTHDLGNTRALATDFSLGSSLIIPAGTVTEVDVYADAKTANGIDIRSGDEITATLVAETSNAQGQDSRVSTGAPYGSTSSSDVSGNPLTVTSSALTATKYSGYGDQTALPGSQNERLGSFTLSAGSTEGINVNTIAMDLNNAEDVTNLTLKDSSTGTQLGSIITTPANTGNSFSVNFTIPASGTQTIDIYGNVLSTATDTAQIYATLTTSTTGTGAVTSTSAPLSGTKKLQTITIGSGLLTVARSASNPVDANVVAGSSQVEVNDYTFTSQNSPYTIQKLELRIPNGAATSTTGVTLQYQDANGNTQTATGAVALDSSASSTVTFSGLSMYVPGDDSADLKVFVGIPTVANGAGSGAAVTTELLYGGTSSNFQAIDSTGSATTSIMVASSASTAGLLGYSSGYGKAYVRKSIPTFAVQPISGAPAAGSAIYRVNVSADAAGAVDLDQMTFKIATTTATAAGFTLYDVTGGNATALNSTAVQADANGYVKIPFGTIQQIGADQTKTYELRPATVSGWQTGAAITVSLAQDTSYTANAAATGLTGSNYLVWSDRSASNHATAGTSATDWTNGYLLKDFTNDVQSFTY